MVYKQLEQWPYQLRVQKRRYVLDGYAQLTFVFPFNRSIDVRLNAFYLEFVVCAHIYVNDAATLG